MKLEAKLEDIRNVRDKVLMEQYIDERVIYMADLYDTISYLLSEAELTAMETLNAVCEYKKSGLVRRSKSERGQPTFTFLSPITFSYPFWML